MTTPPDAGPDAPAGSQAPLRLSRLLKRPVTDRGGGSLGRLAAASLLQVHGLGHGHCLRLSS